MLTEVLTDFSETLSKVKEATRLRKEARYAKWRESHLFKDRVAASALGAIVVLAIGLILIATLGIQALQILATAGTTSFQSSVTTMMIIVVPIIFAIALIVVLLKHGAGIHI